MSIASCRGCSPHRHAAASYRDASPIRISRSTPRVPYPLGTHVGILADGMAGKQSQSVRAPPPSPARGSHNVCSKNVTGTRSSWVTTCVRSYLPPLTSRGPTCHDQTSSATTASSPMRFSSSAAPSAATQYETLSSKILIYDLPTGKSDPIPPRRSTSHPPRMASTRRSPLPTGAELVHVQPHLSPSRAGGGERCRHAAWAGAGSTTRHAPVPAHRRRSVRTTVSANLIRPVMYFDVARDKILCYRYLVTDDPLQGYLANDQAHVCVWRRRRCAWSWRIGRSECLFRCVSPGSPGANAMMFVATIGTCSRHGLIERPQDLEFGWKVMPLGYRTIA